jgi:glycosyltransferase involved in cell wall biosynthesis
VQSPCTECSSDARHPDAHDDSRVARALQREPAMSNPPTRMLLATDAGGGARTHGLDLARGLRARGIEVVLASLGPAPTAAERAAAEAAEVPLEHRPLGLEWADGAWRDAGAAGEWLRGLERSYGCDLVHVEGYALASCQVAAPKIVAARGCKLSWWESVLGEPPPPQWTPYREAVSAALASATHVVAPTRWMRQAVERHYGAPPRLSVIHDARQPGGLEAAGKRSFVLGAGRFADEAKNLRTLARAGRALPWPVKIAGLLDGDEAAAEGVDESYEGVELLCALSAAELAELYASAPIFAAPARYEPFGLTILEAALSGCALVLGDIPSLRELWDDAAVFVPPDDVAALSVCLQDLVRHPEMRHEMGLEAQARAAAYRYDDMIEAYLHVYASADAPANAAAEPAAPPEERECTSSSSVTR